jgi:glycosyltransferase involved in cell wall biosynthesis
MRIVYLSGAVFPSRRAHGVHIVRMCQAFARNGHETTLVGKSVDHARTQDIYDFYGVESNFRLTLLPCPKVRGSSIFLFPRLHRLLRSYGPEDVLIYARDVYGASLAARLGYRVIYEAHWPPPNAVIHWLEKRLFVAKPFQKLVVISENLKCIYMSMFRRISRVDVCHDGADEPQIGPVVDYPWPGSGDRLQIGYTGHLYPGRGIELILACADRSPQYDFHVIGGMDGDIEYWRRQAGTNVHFHGFIHPALVHLALGKCDVLLMPYQRKVAGGRKGIDTSQCMSPMKLFEYMASRRVIIASDLPVLREVLDERMAVLVPPDNVDEWDAAIQRCEDRAYRETLADNAYNAFREHYTWEKRAQRVLEGIGS